MLANQSNIMVPYKIDTGSDGNIMSLPVYKKLFSNMTNNHPNRDVVVPGSRQVLLGMPDTDMLNIIKTNIDSIGAEDAGDSEWCANMHTVWEPKPKQETDGAEKCYTNMDSILKSRDNNTKPMVKTKSIKTTEYFLSGLTYKSDKKKSAESTQQIHKA